MEAVEGGEPAWRDLVIEVSPGVSAMQAAAARHGAPLGHDFCAISLSDNLKPWHVVARRLNAAADGDFVIALYNPASMARPFHIFEAFEFLPRRKAATTPVAFARAIGRAGRKHRAERTLEKADPVRRRYEHVDPDRLQREPRWCDIARAAQPVAADAAVLMGSRDEQRSKPAPHRHFQPFGAAWTSAVCQAFATITTGRPRLRAASIFA